MNCMGGTMYMCMSFVTLCVCYGKNPEGVANAVCYILYEMRMSVDGFGSCCGFLLFQFICCIIGAVALCCACLPFLYKAYNSAGSACM